MNMTTASRHGSEKIPYTQRKYKGNSGMEKSMPLRFLNVEWGGGELRFKALLQTLHLFSRFSPHG